MSVEASVVVQRKSSKFEKSAIFPPAGDIFVAETPIIKPTLLEMQTAMPYREFQTTSG